MPAVYNAISKAVVGALPKNGGEVCDEAVGQGHHRHGEHHRHHQGWVQAKWKPTLHYPPHPGGDGVLSSAADPPGGVGCGTMKDRAGSREARENDRDCG